MENEEFERLLKSVPLSKKEFSSLTELPYQTVMNWKRSNSVPRWVKSWLENYIKAKDIDIVAQTIKPYIDCDE